MYMTLFPINPHDPIHPYLFMYVSFPELYVLNACMLICVVYGSMTGVGNSGPGGPVCMQVFISTDYSG